MTDNRPIGYWLKHLHNLLEEQFEATLSDLGLARREWQLLHTLAGGPRTAGALREALAPFAGEEGPNIDGVLAGLRSRGWTCGDESRLGLTEAGRSRHDEAAARVGETRKGLLNGLTGAQYAETVRVLSVMAANVEAALADRPVTVDDGVGFPVPGEGERWAVGAVILDGHGRAFAQRRSAGRRLFPDAWDIVGGHVEPGETPLEALSREVFEETGWRLRRVRHCLGVTTWEGDDGGGLRHEADFLVEVDGDLSRPALEWSKHSAYDWFGSEDLPRLKENRAPGEYLIHDLLSRVVRGQSQ